MALKYLFDVEFEDGSVYTQNKEDKSLLEEKKSCFYDVLNSGKKIKLFMLSDGKDAYAVDLTDGRFEVNGKSFYMHEERDLKDFRIIFFRQHTHNFNIDTKEQLSHEIVFRMGFQANDQKGNNIQRVMEIK